MCANAVRVEISAWPWHGRRISLQTFYRSVVIAKPTKFNASSAWCCFHHQCCRSLTRPTKSTKSLRYGIQNNTNNILLISYLCRDITYHLDPVLSASQPHGPGTPCLFVYAKPSHFLPSNAILRLTFSSQLTPPPSDPPSNAP